MTSIVHGGAFNTTVLNPPNLNGFGAAANRCVACRCRQAPAVLALWQEAMSCERAA